MLAVRPWAAIAIVLLAGACGDPPPRPREQPAPEPVQGAESVDPVLEHIEKAAACPFDERMAKFEDCADMDAWKAYAEARQGSADERGGLAQSMVAATRHPDPHVRLLAARALRLGHLPDPKDGARQILDQLRVETVTSTGSALARVFRGVDIAGLGVVEPVLDVARTTKDDSLLNALLVPLGAAADRCAACAELLLSLARDPARSRVQASAIRALGDGRIPPEGCEVLAELTTSDDRSGPIVAFLAFVKTGKRCADRAETVVADIERRVAADEPLTQRLLGIRTMLKRGELAPPLKARLVDALRSYVKRAGKAEKRRVKALIDEHG